MSPVRPALGILRMHLKRSLQYRLAAWAQLTTNTFWGFVHAVIIIVFYRYGRQGAAASSGMTISQAVSYVWLVQIALYLIPTFSIDREIRDLIRSGDVGIELCRPLDLYWHWFARTAASRFGRFLLQVPPVALVAMLLPAPYRLLPPASTLALLLALLSLLLGFMLSCAVVGIIYVLLLQVRWGDGPVIILTILTDVLSGSYLPLQLWPASAQRFLYAQPFASLLDLPLRFYLGTLAPAEFVGVAAMQILWATAFVALGWVWMRRSLQYLVVQGG